MAYLLNFHPPVAHFPIALLLLASASGLLYLYWRPYPELQILTWRPMLLGWIGAGVAVLTGLMAQSGLPPQPPYGVVLNWHIGVGLSLIVVYGALLYLHWLQTSKHARRRRNSLPLQYKELLDDPAARLWVAGLLVLGAMLVGISGWSGGQLVYTWGVNVGN